MKCPYLIEHEKGYYICKASTELISEGTVNKRVCLSDGFKDCFEYKCIKFKEKIKKEIGAKIKGEDGSK